MSAVAVTESKFVDYPRLGRYFYCSLEGGVHQIFVVAAPHEFRVIVTSNASHKCWRGMGRGFRTAQEAIDYYRTPIIKTMIAHALELSKGVQP